MKILVREIISQEKKDENGKVVSSRPSGYGNTVEMEFSQAEKLIKEKKVCAVGAKIGVVPKPPKEEKKSEVVEPVEEKENGKA